MMELPDFIEKLLPVKVVERLYEDAASDTAKEVGKIGVDLIKTARLFLAPFQLAAAFQDRFERLVKRIAHEVPSERLIQAPAEVVGPAVQQMQFLEEDNPLWQMFENLLRCSIDRDEVKKVHPSFTYLISQLSRDEAMILYRLRDSDFQVVDTMDLNRERNRFENRIVEKSDIPSEELALPDQVPLYYSHLESLSLITWPVENEEYLRNDEGVQTARCARRGSRSAGCASG